jgi:hypothetical protein
MGVVKDCIFHGGFAITSQWKSRIFFKKMMGGRRRAEYGLGERECGRKYLAERTAHAATCHIPEVEGDVTRLWR